jgi:two-component system LytT family response regulator
VSGILIVDGEPLARSLLMRLCRPVADLEVVGQADSGAAALEAARALRPDVMLLEVNLPDMTGFELLRALRIRCMPASIFITTDPTHALAAFDAGAVDFLVKPVRAPRFAEAIRRARGHGDVASAGRTEAAWAVVEPSNRPAPRLLAAERERRLYLLDPEKVDYIESYGNYVRIWSSALCYISRHCIKELAALLAPCGFVRIQRSKLINLRAVTYIERPGHGLFTFALRGGAQIESTSTYRADIVRALYPADLARRWPVHTRAATRSETDTPPTAEQLLREPR